MENLKNFYNNYRQNSLNVFPAFDKRPYHCDKDMGIDSKKTFLNLPWKNNAKQIGVYTGRVSGTSDNSALIVWDFDFRGSSFGRFLRSVVDKAASKNRETHARCLLNTCVIESTPSGGLHLAYRVQFAPNDTDKNGVVITPETVDSYLKSREFPIVASVDSEERKYFDVESWEYNLDSNDYDVLKKFTFTETRAYIDNDGGVYGKKASTDRNGATYFNSFELFSDGHPAIISPSENYTLLQGDWANIPPIDNDLHKIIVDAAESVATYKPAPRQIETFAKPFIAMFNNDSAIEYCKQNEYGFQSLIQNGYEILREIDGQIHLRRPGGTDTTGVYYRNTKTFTCFTSSDENFAPGTYTDFTVYAKFNYDGDTTAAARALFDEMKGINMGIVRTYVKPTVDEKKAIESESDVITDNATIETTDEPVETTILSNQCSIERDRNRQILSTVVPESYFPIWNGSGETSVAYMPDVILKSDGLLGEWLRYTRDSSLYYQPELSVGAFMTTFGFHLSRRAFLAYVDNNVPGGRRYVINSGLYGIGIAPPSSGKNVALETIRFISDIETTRDDMPRRSFRKQLIHKTASPVALEEKIEKFRKIFQCYDEIAGHLKCMIDPDAKNQNSLFGPLYNELYTSYTDPKHVLSSGILKKQRAKEAGKDSENIEIPYPSLSIFGMTNSVELGKSLRGDSLLNGFFARLDLYTGRIYDRSKTPSRFGDCDDDDNFLTGIDETKYSELVERFRDLYNLNPDSDDIELNVAPLNVKFSNRIWERLNQFFDATNKIGSCYDELTPMKLKIDRINEQTIRYAFIIAASIYGKTIAQPGFRCDDSRIAELAIALGIYQLEVAQNYLINGYAENNEDKAVKIICDFVAKKATAKNGYRVSASDLANHVSRRGIKLEDKKRALETALSCERITPIYEENVGTNGRKYVKIYYAPGKVSA